MIAPVAGPLSLAPRVPHEADFLSFAVLELDLLSTDQRVGMSIDKPDTLHVGRCQPAHTFLAGSYSSAHGEFLLVGEKDSLPKALFVLNLIVCEELRWTSGQRVQSLACRACFNPLVTTKHFSPCLLDDQNPDFV